MESYRKIEDEKMNSNTKNEKIYEKYAWIIFFAIGAITLVSAVFHALGINSDPAFVKSIAGHSINELNNLNPMFFNLYDFYFRSGGLSDMGFAFFLIVISVTAYRQGDKWAWYAFWFVPAFFLGYVALSLTIGESGSSLLPPLIMFILLSILGLLLPFRKFFPR